MKQQYFVSFLPGTSGKFISSILWKLIHGDEEEVQYTENNAAHTETPWWTEDVDKTQPDDPEIYENHINHLFDFLTELNDVHVIPTHSFPNFDALRTKFEDAKTIIVSFDETDIPEIANNWAYKNDIGGNLDVLLEGLRNSINDEIDGNKYFAINKFFTATVPEDLQNRVFLVNYKDIYQSVDGAFPLLTFLGEITGGDITDSTYNSYKKYVNNRNEIWNK